MATIDLGRIKPVWQGTWAGSTAYEVEDIVRHGTDSYICTTAHTSDATTFSNDSANWETMAEGASLPAQSGQSGKVLKTDGSALSWAEESGGTIVQAHTSLYTGQDFTTTSMSGQLAVTFAPQYADSRFLFMTQIYMGVQNHDVGVGIKFDISGASPGGTVSPAGTTGMGDRTFGIGGFGAPAGLGTAYAEWAITANYSHFLYEPPTNMGTSSRTWQVLVSRLGSSGAIQYNRTYNGGTDARRMTTTSVLTVMELRA